MVQAQSVAPIPATLNTSVNGGAAIVSNCSNPTANPPSGCANASLSTSAAVTIQSQTSVVLGPGFTAAGSSNSQLLVQVVPSAPTLTTSAGTTLPGAGPSAALGLTASSPYWNGQGVVQLLINTQWETAHACYVEYVQASNAFYLLSDDASQWLTTTNSNSQCTLLSTSSASQSGNSINVTFTLSFTAAFAGNMQVWSVSYDGNGESSEWQQLGTWNTSSTEPVTLTTNPVGLAITADGSDYATPASLQWNPGSAHTVTAIGPQTSGLEYAFIGWADGVTAASRTITVGSSPATYTANYATAATVTIVTNPPGLTIAIDGANAASPQTFTWFSGSAHTLAAQNQLANGSQ